MFMKTNYLAVLIVVSMPFVSTAQSPRNIRKEATLLKAAMSHNHVQPKVIDDKFSASLFDALLNELDPQKLYFAETDIKTLTPYRNFLDEELYGANWVFLGKVKELYQACLKRAAYDITTTLDAPLVWNEKDVYDVKAKTWANDAGSLKLRHQLWLKHRVLNKLGDMFERDSLTTPENFLKANLAEAVKRVKTIELRNVHGISEYAGGLDVDIGEVLVNRL